MSKLRIKDYLFGYARIELPDERKTEILDKFIKNKVIFRTLTDISGKSTIIVYISEIKYIKKVLGENFNELKMKCGGLSYVLSKYKSRPGILVGLILAILIVAYFSLLVWNIEISGNQTLSDAYILDVLDDYGLKIGATRASVDIDRLTQSILIEDGNIGWLSVNFRGTCAFVEVIEYAPGGENSADNKPRNIVAKRGGRLLEIDVYEGMAAAEIGDTIKEGDLLIGGIIDSAGHGYKLKSADGRVIAEVKDDFHIEIPYTYSENIYTGNTLREKVLKLFGYEIKVFKNSRNVYDKCDIIENIRRVELFDRIKLPLEIIERTYNEYEVQHFSLTQEAASEIANSRLEEELVKLSAVSDVTHKKITTLANDDSFVIDAVIYHTEDIAKAQPISVSEIKQ